MAWWLACASGLLPVAGSVTSDAAWLPHFHLAPLLVYPAATYGSSTRGLW